MSKILETQGKLNLNYDCLSCFTVITAAGFGLFIGA